MDMCVGYSKSAVGRVAILPIVAGVAVVRTGVATAFAAGQVKLAVMVSVAILVTVVPEMCAVERINSVVNMVVMGLVAMLTKYVAGIYTLGVPIVIRHVGLRWSIQQLAVKLMKILTSVINVDKYLFQHVLLGEIIQDYK